MDSNSVAQLVAAFAESQKASAPIVTQNSVLIITMIIAAFGPIISGLSAWLASKAAENTKQAKEEIVKIHSLVNSQSELAQVKIESLEKAVKEMTIHRATSDEKERNQAIKDATAPPSQISSVTELSPAVIAEIVKGIKANL